VDQFFATSDGVRLHYLEVGIGPTLVFVPGWTMPGRIWQAQIDYFSDRYRVVAFDPRAQGDSEKPAKGNYPERRAQDLKELIEHLGGVPVMTVGWSMGMTELLTYVEQFGTAAINAFVLVDTFFVKPAWFQRDILKLAHQLEINRARATEAYIRGMYTKPQPDDYISGLLQASLATPTDTAVALLTSFLAQDDWRPALRKIDKPTMYIAQGALRGESEILRMYVPTARISIFEESGHALFVEEADRFSAIVENFLAPK
jgi:non-heme chloroperoxidase